MPSLILTDNELLCLLSAGICQMAQIGYIPESDPEARGSAAELRSAVQKIRRAVDMDDQTFAVFCAAATPGREPDPDTVQLFQEIDGSRSRVSEKQPDFRETDAHRRRFRRFRK